MLINTLSHFSGLKIISGISIEGSTRMMLEGGGKKSKWLLQDSKGILEASRPLNLLF